MASTRRRSCVPCHLQHKKCDGAQPYGRCAKGGRTADQCLEHTRGCSERLTAGVAAPPAVTASTGAHRKRPSVAGAADQGSEDQYQPRTAARRSRASRVLTRKPPPSIDSALEEEEEGKEEEGVQLPEDSALSTAAGLLSTTAYSVEGYVFDGNVWTVSIKLNISKHDKFKSCRKYEGKIWLKRPNEEQVYAGYCDAVLIDKDVTNKKGQELWIQELLKPKYCRRKDLVRHADPDHIVTELERYVQMYYGKNGTLRPAKELEPVRQSMPAARRFLAIEDFFLEKPFRGKCLSKIRVSLAGYVFLYQFTGYVFLSPAAFWHVYEEDAAERKAKGLPPRSKLGIEAALRTSYQSMGYRLLILGDLELNGEGITIIDRSFTKEGIIAELEALKQATVQTSGTGDIALTAGRRRETESDELLMLDGPGPDSEIDEDDFDEQQHKHYAGLHIA